MNKFLLLFLILIFVLFVNKDSVESFILRQRHRMKKRLHHRDIYPIHHHYTPRTRRWYRFFTDWSDHYYHLPCKVGCVNIGNEGWGCQYPGNGVNECIFSRDCQGC